MRSAVDSGVVLVSHGFQQAYERGFCNGLASNGVDVCLISSDKTDYSRLLSGVRTVNLRGSQDTNRSLVEKLLNQISYHLKLSWFVLRHWRRPVHVIGMIEPLLMYGVVFGSFFRLRAGAYFLTVHDLVPHDRHTRYQRALSRASYRLPHRLIVHTERMRDELVRDYAVAPGKITVMEHGIEPLGAEPPARHKAADAPFHILFFGRVAFYKGVDILLEALELYPRPFVLTIAGRCGDRPTTDDLLARIARHPRRDAISWQNDFILEEQVPVLFDQADVLALPYRHIDQSGVLFQALRFGTPVVATRVGSFVDYVSPAVGELCAPTARSVCDALARLGERLPELDRSSIARIGRQFEWATTVRPVVSAYTSC